MPAKPLMIVGTTSHAGKSLVATAFCRLFREMGYRVAPFKAQNMSNNSFVTREGGEMGRAQVGQAEAAGVEPHVDMNPVLLKPTSDKGSQVLIHGRPIGTLAARAYYDIIDDARRAATESYNRLAAAYDIIVLEGAGSPVELNIRHRDIVNMAMAVYANAPTLLVADIERGGVFASVVGTYRLLREEEHRLMVGTVVNKFRGDLSLFDDGRALLQQESDMPCLGVLPHLPDLRVDEEDSVSLSDLGGGARAPEIVIGVPALPRVSNFTDLAPLAATPSVEVRSLVRPQQVADCDSIILPGTKSTIQDMHWLEDQGLAQAIVTRHREHRIPLIGLCGGYQMLGDQLLDPQGVEGDEPVCRALGLLPVTTTFHPGTEKTTSQIRAEALPDHPFLQPGTPLEGYEIHSGESLTSGCHPAHRLSRRGDSLADMGEGAWVVTDETYVLGTYIHGFFDTRAVALAFLNDLRRRKGLCALAAEDIGNDAGHERERSYARLASALREHLSLAPILAAMGIQ